MASFSVKSYTFRRKEGREGGNEGGEGRKEGGNKGIILLKMNSFSKLDVPFFRLYQNTRMF